MSLTLGIPSFDNHDVVRGCLAQLAASVSGDTTVIIVDNASDPPYRASDYDVPFPLSVIRNERNMGNFYPLRQLPEADVLALMHNDLLIYERGWDERLMACFAADPRLGMVGFAGSNEVDIMGGRGLGTMCNFRGERGQTQAQTGRRVTDLRASLILDALFLAFRPAVLPSLTLDESLPPAHFYDKIWPAQAIEAGWRVATLGIEVDHLGGRTLVGQAAALKDDWARWCTEHGVDPGDDPGLAMYREAERRWLSEWRDNKHFMPARITPYWRIDR